MKSVEWMPFLGDRFFGSEAVAKMDDAATALYLWLLWQQYKHGPLPPPEALRQLPHRWQRKWTRVWPQVSPCFEVLEAGRLSDPGLEGIRQRFKHVYLAEGEPSPRGIRRLRREKEARRLGSHTRAEWFALTGLVGQICPRCEAEGLFEKDHVLPLSMGGSDGIDNIQPLCRPCNRGKGREAIDWLAVRGLR